jgi:NAD-dependent dihydropyrimidine dehydrogenase PreA subunit
MNEFNEKYGDGKKWYLNSDNYSDSWLDDPERYEYVKRFYGDITVHDARSFGQAVREEDRKLSSGERRRVLKDRVEKQKIEHYGQVIPLEDLEQVFRSVKCIIRLACLCRYMYEGKTEFRSCYVLSSEENGGRLKEILDDLSAEYLYGEHVHGVEVMSLEDALADIRNLDQQGLVHTIWTLGTPFIATVCNCDMMHCSSMYTTLKSRIVSTFMRAEYVAVIDRDKCIGCRKCRMACQFGCLDYGVAAKKMSVNQEKCFGCGVCRDQCPTQAIKLVDRESVPGAAGLYDAWGEW